MDDLVPISRLEDDAFDRDDFRFGKGFSEMPPGELRIRNYELRMGCHRERSVAIHSQDCLACAACQASGDRTPVAE